MRPPGTETNELEGPAMTSGREGSQLLDEHVAEGSTDGDTERDTASIRRIGSGSLECDQVVEGRPNTDGSGRLQRSRIVEPNGNR